LKIKMQIFMTPDPESTSISRLIRWCFGIFLVSGLFLTALLIYAYKKGDLMIYFTSAGIIYVGCCTFFLLVIMVAFISGHLGTSSEIEAPKLEIFEMEKKR
jgi:hypothetical protein